MQGPVVETKAGIDVFSNSFVLKKLASIKWAGWSEALEDRERETLGKWSVCGSKELEEGA